MNKLYGDEYGYRQYMYEGYPGVTITGLNGYEAVDFEDIPLNYASRHLTWLYTQDEYALQNIEVHVEQDPNEEDGFATIFFGADENGR